MVSFFGIKFGADKKKKNGGSKNNDSLGSPGLPFDNSPPAHLRRPGTAASARIPPRPLYTQIAGTSSLQDLTDGRICRDNASAALPSNDLMGLERASAALASSVQCPLPPRKPRPRAATSSAGSRPATAGGALDRGSEISLLPPPPPASVDPLKPGVHRPDGGQTTGAGGVHMSINTTMANADTKSEICSPLRSATLPVHPPAEGKRPTTVFSTARSLLTKNISSSRTDNPPLPPLLLGSASGSASTPSRLHHIKFPSRFSVASPHMRASFLEAPRRAPMPPVPASSFEHDESPAPSQKSETVSELYRPVLSPGMRAPSLPTSPSSFGFGCTLSHDFVFDLGPPTEAACCETQQGLTPGPQARDKEKTAEVDARTIVPEGAVAGAESEPDSSATPHEAWLELHDEVKLLPNLDRVSEIVHSSLAPGPVLPVPRPRSKTFSHSVNRWRPSTLRIDRECDGGSSSGTRDEVREHVVEARLSMASSVYATPLLQDQFRVNSPSLFDQHLPHMSPSFGGGPRSLGTLNDAGICDEFGRVAFSAGDTSLDGLRGFAGPAGRKHPWQHVLRRRDTDISSVSSCSSSDTSSTERGGTSQIAHHLKEQRRSDSIAIEQTDVPGVITLSDDDDSDDDEEKEEEEEEVVFTARDEHAENLATGATAMGAKPGDLVDDAVFITAANEVEDNNGGAGVVEVQKRVQQWTEAQSRSAAWPFFDNNTTLDEGDGETGDDDSFEYTASPRTASGASPLSHTASTGPSLSITTSPFYQHGLPSLIKPIVATVVAVPNTAAAASLSANDWRLKLSGDAATRSSDDYSQTSGASVLRIATLNSSAEIIEPRSFSQPSYVHSGAAVSPVSAEGRAYKAFVPGAPIPDDNDLANQLQSGSCADDDKRLSGPWLLASLNACSPVDVGVGVNSLTAATALSPSPPPLPPLPLPFPSSSTQTYGPMTQTATRSITMTFPPPPPPQALSTYGASWAPARALSGADSAGGGERKGEVGGTSAAKLFQPMPPPALLQPSGLQESSERTTVDGGSSVTSTILHV